jgi:hypothetical protein
MRCLRAITTEKQRATVFLSKENFDTLNNELQMNFNMELKELTRTSKPKTVYQVRVVPPPKIIKLKKVWHEYSLKEKGYTKPVDFQLDSIDYTKYQSTLYTRSSIAHDVTIKEKDITQNQGDKKYSAITLVAEISRYLNISCLLTERILHESVDGVDAILNKVNQYNEVLFDSVIPSIFNALFDVVKIQKTEDRDVILLKNPKDKDYYEFSGEENLVLTNKYPGFTADQIKKSFHADTYCFDSIPEKECFIQYISSPKVKEVYFTGMFTAEQGDLYFHYYDPESRRIRRYYPDFLAKMSDGTYQIIEVKGDNKIDDAVVQAKKEAAEEVASVSGVSYIMYPGSVLTKTNVLDE